MFFASLLKSYAVNWAKLFKKGQKTIVTMSTFLYTEINYLKREDCLNDYWFTLNMRNDEQIGSQ